MQVAGTDFRGRAREENGEDEQGGTAWRWVVAALLLVVVFLFFLLRGGDEYTVTAQFQNASQIVSGNEVVVGGTHAGTVDEIELGPNGSALVTVTVDEQFAPLHRGTTATIRQTSLSSVAGRQVQLTPPPDSQAGEEIPSGGVLDQSETVSAVDLDQIFNTLSPKTINDLKRVIQGFELSYDGVGEQANRGLRYFNPFLSTSRRVFAELTFDQRALEGLIVDVSQLSGALAERAPDISALVGNLNRMMNAIGDRRERLAEAIRELPGFMRSANTTFVNLRAALDDVDPLVEASKPVAVRLRPFLAELRAAAADAVPTVRDLDAIVKRGGDANDLVDLNRIQPRLTASAVGPGSPSCGQDPSQDFAAAADDDFTQGAFGESVCALTNGLPPLEFFRPYTVELVGWFNDFGTSGQFDANGTFGRIGTTFNTFSFSDPGAPQLLTPPEALENSPAFSAGNTERCPGNSERDTGDGSTPFTDAGALDCDPSQVPTGP